MPRTLAGPSAPCAFTGDVGVNQRWRDYNDPNERATCFGGFPQLLTLPLSGLSLLILKPFLFRC